MKPETYLFFYDEHCGMCSGFARRLVPRTRGRVRAAPIFGPEADRWIADVSAADRDGQAYLVTPEGGRAAGDEAIWQVLYLTPFGWVFRPLRWIPGFRWLSRVAYRWVADHRRALSCRLPAGGANGRGRKPAA